MRLFETVVIVVLTFIKFWKTHWIYLSMLWLRLRFYMQNNYLMSHFTMYIIIMTIWNKFYARFLVVQIVCSSVW